MGNKQQIENNNSHSEVGKHFSLQKRLLSFRFAFKGIFYFFRTQHNAWIHAVIAVSVVIFGFLFQVSEGDWLFLVFAIGLVLVAELLNTALETLTDLVSPDFHPKAGLVKDVAAGAVLVAAITAVIIGLIIFLPKFVSFFISLTV